MVLVFWCCVVVVRCWFGRLLRWCVFVCCLFVCVCVRLVVCAFVWLCVRCLFWLVCLFCGCVVVMFLVAMRCYVVGLLFCVGVALRCCVVASCCR